MASAVLPSMSGILNPVNADKSDFDFV